MDIKVGAYILIGEFKSRKNAKETFLTHYPLVTESDLDTELDKIFKDADKSRDIIEPASEGNSPSAAVDKGAAGKKQSGKD